MLRIHIMSLLRSFLPDEVNDPLWFVIGRTINTFKYYSKSESFNAHEVFPGIYIGDLSSSLNKYALKGNNIKNILSVLNGCDENYPNDFKYNIIHVNDDDWIDISEYFDECVEFIDIAMRNNEKILVHCSRGVSRSVTMVLAYLIVKQDMTYDVALETVRSKRIMANPNDGFKRQLLEYINNSCDQL